MGYTRKWVAVVAKLTRLTQEGQLVWTRRKSPSTLGSESQARISEFYGTNFQGKNIGIFLKTEKHYSEEELPYNYSRPALALFSDAWECEWECPDVAGTSELYDAVRYEVAGVDQWLNTFMNDYDYEQGETRDRG